MGGTSQHCRWHTPEVNGRAFCDACTLWNIIGLKDTMADAGHIHMAVRHTRVPQDLHYTVIVKIQHFINNAHGWSQTEDDPYAAFTYVGDDPVYWYVDWDAEEKPVPAHSWCTMWFRVDAVRPLASARLRRGLRIRLDSRSPAQPRGRRDATGPGARCVPEDHGAPRSAGHGPAAVDVRRRRQPHARAPADRRGAPRGDCVHRGP